MQPCLSLIALAVIAMNPSVSKSWELSLTAEARASNGTDAKKTAAPVAAHVHGQARLVLARENAQTLSAAFEAPAQVVVGFEHQPKNQKEKDAQTVALKNFSANFLKSLGLPKDAKCSLSKESVKIESDSHEHKHGHHHKKDSHSSEHSEVVAEFSIRCQNLAPHPQLNVDFSQSLSRLESLEVQVLLEGGQSATKFSKGRGTLSL